MDDLLLKKEEDKQLIFFNEALEYFDDNLSKPQDRPEKLYRNSNILREEMLEELENLKELLLHWPDIKFDKLSDEQKKIFQDFIRNFSICPVCGGFNHYYNLKNVFFSEDKQLLLDLLRLIKRKDQKFRKLNINFGIPCCTCFKKYFQQQE